MAISVFDLFKIGIGPSSSHTGGPMAAAHRFAEGLRRDGLLAGTASVRVTLYGSLGLTGKGHGSDKAVILGLEGDRPELVDVDQVDDRLGKIRESGALRLLDDHEIPFAVGEHLVFERKESLPGHPNGMRFTALDAAGDELRARVYYSVGGGFVVDETATGADRIKSDDTVLPHPFDTGTGLLERCRETGLSVSALMMENEEAFGRTPREIREALLGLWDVMKACVTRGCAREGLLPGGLKVRRRAPQLHRQLSTENATDPLHAMDWVTLFALAVNEENAAGGRIVTAPTNGAAGIIPAVLHYYDRFVPGCDDDGVVRFLLTAGAIGVLFKQNASISGAEVGCQGEVGSACSMAAAGLTEVLGGTPEQVENAAEIGIEHNLGLTCDPVGGLVQVPCIERNAVGAIKAISAARISLRGDGRHFVSLDKAIKTMRDTGRDMLDKYKETSRGGLAVNVIEC
ncbi:L-serine ammonia-lyase [Actinomadura livida]|uniref:L-serine dehydratase n=1 Tax=Actinomadura livida TaxID=79909 RepID=A0A7W7II64_9ACTN|nr:MULTISPECIES: L-serine ammonia-lyase [Actinomadura]MBB4777553.1 L-serine dehydratase [Actinomadura catellatispora]GGU00335.1 L-serine dehydratase [Actinomadura livida]